MDTPPSAPPLVPAVVVLVADDVVALVDALVVLVVNALVVLVATMHGPPESAGVDPLTTQEAEFS